MIVYGRGKYARTEGEAEGLIDDIINNLAQRVIDPSGYETVPERAVLCIVGDDYPERTNNRHANNCLYVSVNTQGEYGALKWWTNNVSDGAPKDDVSRFVWTSGSPNPPAADPGLISDPGTPSYYPRKAAIPIKQVREAVEEFCRARTGARPECVSWLLLEQSV
ncbi:Imm1 family immunity protein [Streptomyces sp. NPDC059743]|uniref:Imm1 family immunity protein n=1 Tax=Streptomyces sp. NPDC059743 TaxID=3346928 RepID=UPI00365A16EC